MEISEEDFENWGEALPTEAVVYGEFGFPESTLRLLRDKDFSAIGFNPKSVGWVQFLKDAFPQPDELIVKYKLKTAIGHKGLLAMSLATMLVHGVKYLDPDVRDPSDPWNGTRLDLLRRMPEYKKVVDSLEPAVLAAKVQYETPIGKKRVTAATQKATYETLKRLQQEEEGAPSTRPVMYSKYMYLGTRYHQTLPPGVKKPDVSLESISDEDKQRYLYKFDPDTKTLARVAMLMPDNTFMRLDDFSKFMDASWPREFVTMRE